jgi:putative peptidoglycan lipid II flippase
MIRAFLTVSSGTLASRLLGFARDSMIAGLLGTGPVADAFLMGFQLVNVVRRMLTEGALNAALIPAWLRVRESDGPTAAAAFAGRVLGTISTALIVAAALIGLLMPLALAVLAPGFAQPTLQLAVDDARLMLPYLAFAGPVTVLMALMNAQGRFAMTAFSPLLFNTALIAVMVGLLGWRWDPSRAAPVMAATVGIAGLLQLLILLWRHGGSSIATPLRISFDAKMRGFFGKAIPGMMAGAGPQLVVLAGAVIASSSPAAVSWLYFANRLMELPLGIVGVAMGTVLVPELTRAVRGGDRSAVAHAESRAIELAIGLALPATLGLVVLAAPIVRMLFEHGAFTAADTAATAQALGWLAVALPAHVLVKVLAPSFFARDDTFTPLLATLKGLAVAIVLALVLGHVYGTGGIAAAIALGAWSNAVTLIRHGAVEFGFSIDAAARGRLPRIVLAALTMGGILWLASRFVPGLATGAHGITQAVVLVLSIGGGVAIYSLLLSRLGVIGWSDAIGAVRQSAGADLRA